MDKEEIINIVKDFISYIRFNEKTKYGVRKQYMAIEGLLDLYNKEKEKNKELENKYNDLKQIEEKHRIENGELRTKINELEREVEGLKQTFIIHDDIDNHIPHID